MKIFHALLLAFVLLLPGRVFGWGWISIQDGLLRQGEPVPVYMSVEYEGMFDFSANMQFTSVGAQIRLDSGPWRGDYFWNNQHYITVNQNYNYTCLVVDHPVTHVFDLYLDINDNGADFVMSATRTFYPPGAPQSWVTMDGHSIQWGNTVPLVRPPEGAVTETIRFKTTDPDSNLASINVCIGDPENHETSTTHSISGSSAEIVRSVAFDKTGQWKLAGWVTDSDNHEGYNVPLYVTVTEQATVTSPTVAVTLGVASGTAAGLTLLDGIPVGSTAAATSSEALNVHAFKWRGAADTPAGLAGLDWVLETAEPGVWSDRTPAATGSPSGGATSSIQAVFHPKRPGWYEFQAEAKSPHSWRASSTTSGVSVYVNNALPVTTAAMPQVVRAGMPFNVIISASQSIYVQGHTGLKVEEWRGPASDVNPLEWGRWVLLANGTTPLPVATWEGQNIVKNPGKVIYKVESWNGDSSGEWLPGKDSNQYTILVKERDPAVVIHILDAAGAPITTGTDGKVRLVLDSSHTIRVSGSDSMGQLASLKTDIYNPQGMLVSSTQTAVSGTTAVGSSVFTSTEIGGWRVKATAWNGDNFSSIINLPVVVESETPPPTTPQGLSASGITDTFFTLSWSPSSGSAGVQDYAVSMGGTAAGTTTRTYKLLAGLSAASVYQMRVRARDTNGLWSGWSAPLAVTTLSAPMDPALDTDGDGVPDIIELELGVSPAVSGTDPDNVLQVKFLTPTE
jgi:hypothetical protein